METEEKGTLDFGAIDFTPDWAKKGAGVSVGRVSPVREDSPGRKPFDRRQGGNNLKTIDDTSGEEINQRQNPQCLILHLDVGQRRAHCVQTHESLYAKG